VLWRKAEKDDDGRADEEFFLMRHYLEATPARKDTGGERGAF
jgi:hypothetical protein